MRIEGGCHCGLVRLELDWRGDPQAIPARACDCGFCTRHGAVWTGHAGSALTVHIDPSGPPPLLYRFGTGSADFHLCGRCGVPLWVGSMIDGRLHAVVSVRGLQLDPALLRHGSASFDGESLEQRLARRARNWIGEVRVETGGAWMDGCAPESST